MKNISLRSVMVLFLIVAISAVVLYTPVYAERKTVKLAYVEWSSEIASAHVVKVVLEEKLGYICQITPMTASEMWESVAAGEQDAMVAAWLPGTHSHYLERTKDQVEDLGPNLEGTRIGLVVPDVVVGRQPAQSGQRNKPYITVNSIAELNDYADKFGGRIIGIDREAGIMKKAKQAIEAYDLYKFRLIEGSEVSMVAELTHAIQKQKWLVVTGWTPHWKFARWKLKYLEDPKNIFGGAEQINTIVRKGLKDDMPEVYEFLDKFSWTPDDMGQLMIWIQEPGASPYQAALRWLRSNPEIVQSWLE